MMLNEIPFQKNLLICWYLQLLQQEIIQIGVKYRAVNISIP